MGLGGALDSAWLVLCGALVMFMHAGFAMLETGCCRAKNASNVLMKNLVMCAVEHWAGGALAGLWLMANRMAMVSLEPTGSLALAFTQGTRLAE